MSKQTAKFAFQRNGVDYQINGADIQDKCQQGDIFYVQRGDTVYKWPRQSVDKVWEEQDFWFHIKNLTEEVFLYPRDEENSNMWDRFTEERVDRLLPGKEYIIGGYNDLFHSIRFEGNNGSWDFGELTDTVLLTKGYRFFADCPNFNGDISVFDQANWKQIIEMFANCSSFNQDISRWDITHIFNQYEIENFLLNASAFTGDLSRWCMHIAINPSSPDYWCKGSGIYTDFRKYPKFACRDYVTNPASILSSYALERDSGTYDNLQPGDLFFATDTDGVTYKVPYTKIEDIVGKEVAILHIKNITGGNVKIQGHDRITDIDGNVVNDGTTIQYTAGEYLVYGDTSQLKDSTGSWDFGPLTSTAKRKSFTDFLKNCEKFNGDIQYLRTDSARDLSYMFSNCFVFNQPVTNFNTSKVNTFRALFQYCKVFNQPVNHFDTSNAENLMIVFQGCEKFNQPVNNWDTSECTTMASLFYSCFEFNQDLSTWNTHKVTSLKRVFNRCKKFNQDISGWDVSNVTNFIEMFCLAEAFNQPIGSWNTKSALDMNYIFYEAFSFDQDISQWCVRKPPSHTSWNYACPIRYNFHPVWYTCPRGEDQP